MEARIDAQPADEAVAVELESPLELTPQLFFVQEAPLADPIGTGSVEIEPELKCSRCLVGALSCAEDDDESNSSCQPPFSEAPGDSYTYVP